MDEITERKQGVLTAITRVVKWSRDDESFEDTIRYQARKGRIPVSVFSLSRTGELRFQSYKWQMACAEWGRSLLRSESTVSERRDELQHKLDNGIGMPSTTDGSKGQWRAALKARIFALDWLLGDEPAGYEFDIETGKSPTPNTEETDAIPAEAFLDIVKEYRDIEEIRDAIRGF